jgi:methionyl aminopeptidase
MIMIVLKTERELKIMRQAGRIAAKALKAAGAAIEPGVSTWEISHVARRTIEKEGATPTFLGYGGYPASACVSVNNVVIHGIPTKKQIIREGDIVSIDVGATFEGFVGDNAFTFPCGKVSAEAQALMDATRESLYEGIWAAVAGNRIGDIGSAIQRYVEARGYSVVREFVGHGVGAKMHEDPSVPNYGTPGRGVRLLPGMTIAIEPMINQGVAGVKTLQDGWTTVTADGKLSAHFEHSIAITPNGPVILTLPD